MWQRFTEDARKVIFGAQQAAVRFNEQHVSVDHLFLGLLEDNGFTDRLLEGFGVSRSKLKELVEHKMTRSEAEPVNDKVLTPASKKVIDEAYAQARQLNNNFIGIEHLMLGIISQGSEILKPIFEEYDITLERMLVQVAGMQDDTLVELSINNPVPLDPATMFAACFKLGEAGNPSYKIAILRKPDGGVRDGMSIKLEDALMTIGVTGPQLACDIGTYLLERGLTLFEFPQHPVSPRTMETLREKLPFVGQ